MKKLLFTWIILCLFNYISFAQNVVTTSLEQNSVRAMISNAMPFFYKYSMGAPGYEVPKNEGNHTVYTSSFWFGGFDQDSVLRASLNSFSPNKEFFSGPISTNASYFLPNYANQYYNKIWKVTKDEIIYHIDNYEHPNYVMSEAIKSWPGNGDTTLGVAWQLAPFVDVDGDGIYSPENGDYPCVKGDAVAYVIMNDDALEHMSTGSNKIGLEAHFMFYQINAENFIDTTTFLNVRLINRGEHNFENFKTSLYMDVDIGFAFDDYIGCDTNLNLSYGYNATPFDPGVAGSSGYGYNPPAFGTIVLNNTMESFMSYSNFVQPSAPYPYPSINLWNYMNAKWQDGTNLVVGGTGHENTYGASSQQTRYSYPGNPYIDEGWTEINIDGNGTANPNNQSKRSIMTLSGAEFNSGDEIEYDLGFVFYNKGGHLENVQGLIDLTPEVQAYYDDVLSLADCLIEGTGVTDPELDYLTEEEESNDMLFEITRLDGEGNMLYPVDLHPSSETEILEKYSVDAVRYALGKGPIYVSCIDTVNYEKGYYVIKVTDNTIDSSSWVISRYSEQGGELIDSVEVNTTLMSGDTTYLYQYGLKVLIKQEKHKCPFFEPSCHYRDRVVEPILSSMSFSEPDLSWLTGVKHNFGLNIENWITSGLSLVETIMSPTGMNSPECYKRIGKDLDLRYSNLIDGIIAPGQLARHSNLTGCSAFRPIQTPGIWSYLNFALYYLPLVYHPSIDIVFTSDTSLWTRCAVIEMNDNEETAQGGAKPGLLRAAPSVDKQGNPDGTGSGMSWFPGYAIDVETGRRLNMAFGENSTLEEENGADMVWNPTTNLYDESGSPVLGGQHVIYVFGGVWDEMPVYDEGEFIRTNLENESIVGYRSVYRNLSWVMQPMLAEGHELLASDTRIRMRINKEFKSYELSGLNEGRPMFGFEVGKNEEEVTEMNITAFPNPTTQQLTVKWSGLEGNVVQLYEMDGKIVQEHNVLPDQSEVTFDVSSLSQGMYIVRVGELTKKIVVN